MKNSIFFVSPYAIILKKYIQESETNMNKLYKAIEEKIKESGYPKEISGRDVYNDICDQIEDKENGTYLLLSKFEEDVIFEYHITIQDDGFNLGLLTIRTPEGIYQTDFDVTSWDVIPVPSSWNIYGIQKDLSLIHI